MVDIGAKEDGPHHNIRFMRYMTARRGSVTLLPERRKLNQTFSAQLFPQPQADVEIYSTG